MKNYFMMEKKLKFLRNNAESKSELIHIKLNLKYKRPFPLL